MAADLVIQTLLITSWLAGCRSDFVWHEQLISLDQLFCQQPIELILQPQPPLLTRQLIGHDLPRDTAAPAMRGLQSRSRSIQSQWHSRGFCRPDSAKAWR